MILTFLYCEGPHDMAFLAKLIKGLNITNSEINTVSDLPHYIKNIVTGALENLETESIRIDKPIRVFFPNKVFALNDGQFICVFSTGGKDSLQAAMDNITRNKFLIGRQKRTGITSIRHAFILDADYKLLENGTDNPQGGLSNTLTNLSRQIKTIVDDFNDFTTHASWQETDHGSIGNFIFTDTTGEEGTLEDLLEQFVKPTLLLAPSVAFRDEIITFDESRKAKAKDKTKQQKIIFTSMTQAFHPGCSLAVGLSEDKVLDKAAINSHSISAEFGAFLSV
ncbi:conserved hypothetical protein [Vibrio chagasii]|uniref:DUF3226 domain-containing protein n=1 Tax=Vibrio chagasii TaxID=170679 RepID=UPI003386C787|nr:conserved hypothetical protein [Vibrio chagasii]